MARRLICLAAAALTAGCTHNLGVTTMPATGGAEGAVYVLPFTQYTTTLTWRLVDCRPNNIRVALKASAVAGSAPDGAQAYVIDPDSLHTAMSIGAFKATWPDGSLMLSSINVSSEDRTGAIVGNIVSGVAQVLPLTLGAPGSPAAAPACEKEAADALTEIGVLKPALEAMTDNVQVATGELAALTARVAALGSAADAATRAQLVVKAEALTNLQLQHQTLSRRLAAALEDITTARTIRWPDASTEARSPVYSIPPAALTAWFGGADPGVSAFQFELTRVGSFGRQPAVDGTLAAQTTAQGHGIRYRTPAIGRLVIYSRPSDPALERTVLTELDGPIAQLGYVNRLPVTSTSFGSTVFGAEFNAAGGLTSVGYEQKAAPLEGLTASAASAAGALAGVLDPAARLANDTTYKNALAANHAAALALQPEPVDSVAETTAALQADTEMRQAWLANYEVLIAVARAQAQAAQ